MKRKAIFTVDVEDWYHASVMQRHLSRMPSYQPQRRLAKNLAALEQWLDQIEAKATFFCLSSLPSEINLQIRRLSDAGHEIASHGHSHAILDTLTEVELRHELAGSKDRLEQITGKAIRGFRAPNFSITDRAIELIAESGYEYDSSVYHVPWHPNYGKLIAYPMGRKPYQFQNGLLEFPLSIWEKLGMSIPLAGGAYVRHLPFGMYKRAAGELTQQGYFHFYIHPWEVDRDHPVPPKLGWIDRVRHFRNLTSVPERINTLSTQISFTSIAAYMADHTKR